MENKPKRNDKERIIILKCRNRQLRDEVAVGFLV